MKIELNLKQGGTLTPRSFCLWFVASTTAGLTGNTKKNKTKPHHVWFSTQSQALIYAKQLLSKLDL